MVTFLLAVVLLIALAVLVGFVVGFNNVRAADIRVQEALAGIDVALMRRASLIPSLVSTVQTYASHELAILDRITEARTALAAATSGASVVERSVAERRLDTAVGQVLALGQAYPDLKSSTNFLDLQHNLADTEDMLAFARQYYNDAVATSNRLITSIPGIFIAGAAGVPERPYYQRPH
jgi:LemA protein